MLFKMNIGANDCGGELCRFVATFTAVAEEVKKAIFKHYELLGVV